MIEIPRAALTADDIAKEADFFCFGTNDLTQMTYGFSRDDAGKFLNAYYDAKIFENDPFAKLDQVGVGKLMKMAIELGKPVNPKLHVGICGEHGGDPSSVEFCNKIGLDYVSCSPFRVPIARLAAAQAAGMILCILAGIVIVPSVIRTRQAVKEFEKDFHASANSGADSAGIDSEDEPAAENEEVSEEEEKKAFELDTYLDHRDMTHRLYIYDMDYIEKAISFEKKSLQDFEEVIRQNPKSRINSNHLWKNTANVCLKNIRMWNFVLFIRIFRAWKLWNVQRMNC